MVSTPAEIAASLTIDEIPVKLRCAACNRLANNAFRTPCCDQAICEDCQSSLPQACPICLHEPVKAEDCRPNKALRTTIKVFLKKKGIEREAARKKEMVDQAVAIPVTPATTQVDETPESRPSRTPIIPPARDVEVKVDSTQGSDGVSHPPETAVDSDSNNGARVLPEQAQMDIARPSIEASNEEIQPNNSSEGTGGGMNGVQEKVDQSEQELEQQGHRQDQHLGLSDQWPPVSGVGPGMKNNSYGFDGTNGFPNMGFNGAPDFSQMIQFMPNGMPNNAMGAFPNMMGMPGMGLDPMTISQSMYGGFGGQGMGINGMNVGMGFNTGQGGFGGFNGQPGAWNTGQDKFNQNAYGGHANAMGGDFGPNAGYGGYNMPSHQGSFNQMHHHQYPNNDYQNGYNGQGFHNRGRGRGRGYHNAGRARGSYNQVMPGNQTNYEPFHHQIPHQNVQQASTQRQLSPQVNQQHSAGNSQNAQTKKTSADQAAVDKAADEQLAKELEPGDTEDGTNTPTNPTHTADVVGESKQTIEAAQKIENQTTVDPQPKQEGEEKLAAIETFISNDHTEPKIIPIDNENKVLPTTMPPPSPVIPLGPAALYSGEQHLDYTSRARGVGRGFHRGMPDYRGGMRGRGSGYLPNGIVTHSTPGQHNAITELPVVTPVEPKGLGVEGAPKAPKALREGLPNTGMRGGRGFSIVGRASAAAQARPNGHIRSRSRSRTRSRSPSRHSHRHRSHRHRSVSSSGSSERDKRRERHRRRSRKYEDEDEVSQEAKETRAGHASVESKKSSHRSHRDSDKDRERLRSSHRSHRSREERSRERGEEARSSRKRSRSAQNDTNGVRPKEDIDAVKSTNIRHKDKNEDTTSSTRKRRDRDDDSHRDRKRSRVDCSEAADNKENHTRSSHSKRNETELNSKHDAAQRTQEKPTEKSNRSPKKPEMDHHELEREARNRERLLKELQRREAMEGKPPAGKKRDSQVNGRTGGGGRRVSYKYEDEETNEARASRVESEREAGRWG